MKNKVYDLYTARQLILDRCVPSGKEKILLEKSSGRVLAADVSAVHNIPLFDRSPLDGFAFRSGDTVSAKEGKITLTVTGEVAAGSCCRRSVKAGEAVKILTGAPIPAGADAVEKFEETEYGGGYVTLRRSYSSGENIVREGEDVRAGDLIAEQGTRIDPELHGQLAAQGMEKVEVYKMPLVGLISQGNELLDPGEKLQEGKIYNTSHYMLGTALKREGIPSIYLGNVEDDEKQIADVLKTAVSMYDAVIMTGGASVGTYDFTKSALERAGAVILVDQIEMKPGSCCCLAILEGVPVFGLSGNPKAAMTTFHLVALPAIRKLAGRKDCLPEKITVELDSDFAKRSPKMRILKGKLLLTDGIVRMYLNGQEDERTGAMRDADVFAVVRAGSGPLKKGSLLEAYIV